MNVAINLVITCKSFLLKIVYLQLGNSIIKLPKSC